MYAFFATNRFPSRADMIWRGEKYEYFLFAKHARIMQVKKAIMAETLTQQA